MVLSESPPLLPPLLPVVVLPTRPRVQSSYNLVGPAFQSVPEGKMTAMSNVDILTKRHCDTFCETVPSSKILDVLMC